MPLHTSNIVMQKTDTTPAGANQTEGSLYYDDSEAVLKQYNGSAWGAVKAPDVNEGGTMRTYQHAGTGTVYQVHIFTMAGAATWKLTGTKSCDILMVGGGGSGGNGLGGGGAGGVVAWATGFSVAAGTYSLYVGKGGNQANHTDMGGTFGEPTWIQTATVGKVEALGGGGGGGETTAGVSPIGIYYEVNSSAPAVHSQRSEHWGNSGGTSYGNTSFYYGSASLRAFSGWTVRMNGRGGKGGGGGANHPSGGGGSGAGNGTTPGSSSAAGGNGADGVNSGAGVTFVTPRLFGESGTHNGVAIDASYYWGGGGGGGTHTQATASGNGGAGAGGGGANGHTGTGGGTAGIQGRNAGAAGGAGGNAAGGAGGENTGAGGGGGCDGTGPGGAGGSGIIVIRYPL